MWIILFILILERNKWSTKKVIKKKDLSTYGMAGEDKQDISEMIKTCWYDKEADASFIEAILTFSLSHPKAHLQITVQIL